MLPTGNATTALPGFGPDASTGIVGGAAGAAGAAGPTSIAVEQPASTTAAVTAARAEQAVRGRALLLMGCLSSDGATVSRCLRVRTGRRRRGRPGGRPVLGVLAKGGRDLAAAPGDAAVHPSPRRRVAGRVVEQRGVVARQRPAVPEPPVDPSKTGPVASGPREGGQPRGGALPVEQALPHAERSATRQQLVQAKDQVAARH